MTVRIEMLVSGWRIR